MVGMPGLLNRVSASKPGNAEVRAGRGEIVDRERVQRVEVDTVVADPEVIVEVRFQRMCDETSVFVLVRGCVMPEMGMASRLLT